MSRFDAAAFFHSYFLVYDSFLVNTQNALLSDMLVSSLLLLIASHLK